jgi:hypothetical protein
MFFFKWKIDQTQTQKELNVVQLGNEYLQIKEFLKDMVRDTLFVSIPVIS